jgi:hypothetical protein
MAGESQANGRLSRRQSNFRVGDYATERMKARAYHLVI